MPSHTCPNWFLIQWSIPFLTYERIHVSYAQTYRQFLQLCIFDQPSHEHMLNGPSVMNGLEQVLRVQALSCIQMQSHCKIALQYSSTPTMESYSNIFGFRWPAQPVDPVLHPTYSSQYEYSTFYTLCRYSFVKSSFRLCLHRAAKFLLAAFGSPQR